MSSFQSVVYSIVESFAVVFPVGAGTHRELIAIGLGWPKPGQFLDGTILLGAALAAFAYYVHDWASMISATLQAVIYRRRPMTLDERIPIFLVVASLPPIALWRTLAHHPLASSLTLWGQAISVLATGLCIWLAERFSRKNKNLVDWNWLDSLWVGVCQCLALLPGAGRQEGALFGAFTRNQSREGAAKFAVLLSFPWLAANAASRLSGIRAAGPDPDTSWLTLGIALTVSFLASLLAIGAFQRNIARRGTGPYLTYRALVCAALLALGWVNSD